MKRIIPIILSTAIATLLNSCSNSTTVMINVKRPPEVNVSDFNRIIVDPIESSSYNRNDGANVRSALIEKLLQSRLFDAVSDSRSASGDERKTVYLSGAVVSDNYLESTEHSQQMVDRKVHRPDLKKDTTQRDSVVHFNGLNGVLRMSTQLRLRDAEHNAILWTTNYDIEKTASSSALNARPAPIYVPGLEQGAVNDVADRLVQSFFSRIESTAIQLLEDSELPELDSGNIAAKKNLWQDALTDYRKAIRVHTNHASLHKAYYNLACAEMVIERFESSEKNFRKAMQSAPNEILYSNTLALCLRMRDESVLMKNYSKP